jgi:hypothetical protein
MATLVDNGLKGRAERAFSVALNPFSIMALGRDNKAEAISDCTLGDEITSGGCARAAGTPGYEATFKGTLVKQFVVTDTFAIEEIGIFDNASLLILDDCEAAWVEFVDPDVVVTADAAIFKVGSKSVKMAVAAGCSAGDILATEVVAADLTTYPYLSLWIRSSVALDLGDLQLLLDDTPLCASPIETINIPAVATPDTWTLVQCPLSDPSLLGSIISLGIKMVVDKGAFDVYLDHVHAPGTMLMRAIYAATRNVQAGDTLQITAKQTESRA